MQTSLEAIQAVTADVQPADIPEIDLIDTEEACAIVGGRQKPIHRSTLWRLVKTGKLPPPHRKLRRWNRRPFLAAVAAMLEEDAA